MSENNTNTNTKRGPGAPPKPISLPKGRNKFTIKDIVEANPDIRATLTIRTKVAQMVSAGTLTLTGEKVSTGKAGAPAKVYWRTNAWEGLRKLRNKKVKLTDGAEEVPAEEVPAEEVSAEAVEA